MSFPCTGCGLCCKFVALSVATAKKLVEDGQANDIVKEVAAFPFKTLENGQCEMLLPDNTCSIYNDRPDICSIERTHAKHFKEFTLLQYQRVSVDACNSLILEAGIDDKYLIDPKLLR